MTTYTITAKVGGTVYTGVTEQEMLDMVKAMPEQIANIEPETTEE